MSENIIECIGFNNCNNCKHQSECLLNNNNKTLRKINKQIQNKCSNIRILNEYLETHLLNIENNTNQYVHPPLTINEIKKQLNETINELNQLLFQEKQIIKRSDKK